MSSEGIAIVDGQVMDLAAAHVPILDRGYLLGDGLFETLRVSNGHIFRLEEHAARLRDSLRLLGLDAGLEEPFRAAVAALVAEGAKRFGSELYLRVNVTTGVMEDIAGDGQGVGITGICKPFKPYPMQYYAKGVWLVRSDHRKDSRDPLATVKSLSFLPYVAARRQAHAAAAHDAVLLNEHGRLVEATTSNLFARSGDTVHAPGPEEGALPGVTRAAVLELLEDIGMDIQERLGIDDLASADEAWITNTTGGVVPVTRFQERDIAKGQKGELVTRLGHAYEDMVRSGLDHDGA